MEGELKACDSCGALVASLTQAPNGDHLCAQCYQDVTGSPPHAIAPNGQAQPAKALTGRLSLPIILRALLGLIAILSTTGTLAIILLTSSRFKEDLPTGASANGIMRLTVLVGMLIGVVAIVGIILLWINDKLAAILERLKH
jgi:hypothetical protein